jgi:asparagine synthase (glutamine-hydrolysing)
LREILADKSSVLYELFNHDLLNQLVESGGNSFKEPWFGQLMSGPQLLAYFIQLDIWFRDYNINIVNR